MPKHGRSFFPQDGAAGVNTNPQVLALRGNRNENPGLLLVCIPAGTPATPHIHLSIIMARATGMNLVSACSLRLSMLRKRYPVKQLFRHHGARKKKNIFYL